MNYIKYIELGFERTCFQDRVEFKQTGYYGFGLKKVINDKISICVTSGNLDKPKLYIKKSIDKTYHILNITFDIVEDLILEKKDTAYSNMA